MSNLNATFLSSLQQQAMIYFIEKDYMQATAAYEQLLEADPDSMIYYWQLGLIQLLQGNETEAQLTWTLALAEGAPERSEAWILELYQVLQTEAERQESLQEYQTAWIIRQHLREIAPADASNSLRIVHLLLQMKQFGSEVLQELDLVELLQDGQLPEQDYPLLFETLAQMLEQALEDPRLLDFAKVCMVYAFYPHALIDILLPKATELSTVFGRNTLACRYGELCLQLDPNHFTTLLLLSRFYQTEGLYAEGIELARRHFAACQTPLQKVFGNSYVLRGLMSTGAQWQEATEVLTRQTELLQSLIETYQINANEYLESAVLCAPLYFYPYFSDRPHQTRAIQNQVAKLFQDSLHSFVKQTAKNYQPYPIAPLIRSDRKKLRIGYIARFMKRHSVGWLSRWVFEHFDRDRFEVYAYFNRHVRIESFSDEWFASKATVACCFNGDSLGVAQAIRADEIDILVDLDSITCDDTCNLMALKPAPVQVTWLGTDASGIPAIDYFLADPYVLPDSAQEYYAEKIWRLPQTYLAVDGFEVGVPTLRRDQLGIPVDAVVYFSSQYAYKRNPEMIHLQMQIIKGVPNSYFIVKGKGDEQGIGLLFEQIAAQEGVSSDRLRFLPQDKDEETHRANLAIADIVLDTFPYNGATTTMETLWMGIPIVTRVGEQFAARNSYTMMMNAGITEGIAWSDAEYIEWGIKLGADADLRRDIAHRLRQSRQTSPLWNAQQFTRDLESAYEQMWQRYLEG
jgi:predicted O-linked N-acetylglucosamine transferase (SPINDLY family)